VGQILLLLLVFTCQANLKRLFKLIFAGFVAGYPSWYGTTISMLCCSEAYTTTYSTALVPAEIDIA